MGKLKNKVAIITGAGQGLGLAYAKVLAKEGAQSQLLNLILKQLNRPFRK